MSRIPHALFLSAWAGLHLLAQDYPILLSRKTPQGLIAEKTTRAAEENRISTIVGKNPVQTQTDKTTVELRARVEELAPSGDGRRLKVTVLDLSCHVNAKPVSTVPAGSVLLAEGVKDETVISFLDGRTIPEDIQKCLRLAISATSNAGDDDRAFGTKDRKKVGDAWPINTGWASLKLKEMGCLVSPENISGKAQLLERLQHQGTECLRIVVSMDLRKIGGIPLPPEFKLSKSVMSYEASGLFPTDLGKDMLHSKEELSAEVIGGAQVPTDQGMVDLAMMMRMIRSSESSWTYLEAPAK